MNSTDRLLDCRRIFLRGIQVNAFIGVHDFEKHRPQRVLVDVDLYVSMTHSSPSADSLEEVVDYDFVRDLVLERVARGPIALQETLCDDILGGVLAHPKVAAARVSTRKPDVYPDCESVGVEVFRFNAPSR